MKKEDDDNGKSSPESFPVDDFTSDCLDKDMSQLHHGKSSTESSKHDWHDVTQEFIEASRELGLGELLHDASFGLFEAMSAIEMMDPKMDAGMMCNQTKRKVLNFEKSVQSGLKIKDFSMSEVIGIIDTTLACLVTWLEGHSLAQTVFTNLYLHNPYEIEDKTIKAFSICTLKLVDIIRDRINRASVYEEEDFQPMSYGFKMAFDVTDMRATGMMKEVEEDFNRLIKNTRIKPGEERDSATKKEHESAVAVHSRMKFCRLLFSTLVAFSKEKCQGIEDADKYLTQMSELLPVMKDSLALGLQPQEQGEEAADYPTIMGFEPLVNQRLLPPTFPRYTKIKSREEMMSYMTSLVFRLKWVCQGTEEVSLHHALEFFHEFSQQAPCVLSRSILQLIYLPQNRRILGSHLITDNLRDTLRNFIAPPGLMPRGIIANNAQVKEYIDTFLTRAVRPVCSLIQLTGHNRARQRDKWAALLEELATLQDEADKVDGYLHGILMKADSSRQHLACFSTWVLYHTLQAMIHYTLAGFELELYAPHEYHYVYWYLSECLYGWLISTLTRTDSYVYEQEMLVAEQQQKGRAAKKNKKKKKTRPHGVEITQCQAYQNLCGGYYKAVVGFTLCDKMKEANFEFDSEEVRFNHRFSPFRHVLTPPVVQYSHFKEMTDLRRYDMKPTSEDLYISACKCFQQAKLLFENLPNQNSEEIQALIKVAKTNFVVMKLLAGGHKKTSTDAPEFDFTVHKIYPTIKIP
ncbi:N-alpha-acetyltransferase 35, NatC auxiliary subunit-like [Lineus longissimus]|uniref:N-alpha-acetyltransferase 35, NatC auxiliary subunit-like n=1 Tax=Lineus longissimus TaxID=88925 RepID=UPI002B4F97A2